MPERPADSAAAEANPRHTDKVINVKKVQFIIAPWDIGPVGGEAPGQAGASHPRSEPGRKAGQQLWLQHPGGMEFSAACPSFRDLGWSHPGFLEMPPLSVQANHIQKHRQSSFRYKEDKILI